MPPEVAVMGAFQRVAAKRIENAFPDPRRPRNRRGLPGACHQVGAEARDQGDQRHDHADDDDTYPRSTRHRRTIPTRYARRRLVPIRRRVRSFDVDCLAEMATHGSVQGRSMNEKLAAQVVGTVIHGLRSW